MRLGIVLIPTDPWQRTLARAAQLESLGFNHLWTYDHLSWQRYRDRPWHAAVPWLAGIAARTRQIRLGTMVTSPNFRHPVLLAKDAMTLDHISDGRLTLGIGAGGIGYDATVFGAPLLSPGERARRLADFVEVVDGLLRHPQYSTDNPRYPVHEARMLPGCAQRPRVPLAIAAAGPKTIALAARFGDAWITEGDPRDPDPTPASLERAVGAQSALLEDRCEQIGRDPAGLDRILLVSNRAERPLRSVAAFGEFVERYAALGFTDVVVHDPRPDDPLWDDDPAVLAAVAELFCSSRPHGGPRLRTDPGP
jgi:alkanesulfonate monooxygenase SsuD/methylene tetrahydromethanopterin reductase-like flavin-dependent oxidoreductase (luciferase family)